MVSIDKGNLWEYTNSIKDIIGLIEKLEEVWYEITADYHKFIRNRFI